jgi:uncharacterized protein
VRFSFGTAKREKTIASRGLDFADSAIVFTGATFEVLDARKNYGEPRILCNGVLAGRMVVVGYAARGADRAFLMLNIRRCVSE